MRKKIENKFWKILDKYIDSRAWRILKSRPKIKNLIISIYFRNSDHNSSLFVTSDQACFPVRLKISACLARSFGTITFGQFNNALTALWASFSPLVILPKAVLKMMLFLTFGSTFSCSNSNFMTFLSQTLLFTAAMRIWYVLDVACHYDSCSLVGRQQMDRPACQLTKALCKLRFNFSHLLFL